MISNEHSPQITAVIPTYKRPKLLKRAIESVLKQTYPNVLVCVCDNASGDGTKEMVLKIAEQDPRVMYHGHDENIGGVNNFNSGMEKVETPYFSLLSDDNILLPNFYEDAIDSLHQNPEAMFFAGQTLRITTDYNKISGSLDRWQPGFIKPPIGLIDIMEKGLPIWEGVLFRSEVIQNTGLLNPELLSSCDQDYMMRIARYHPFFVSKKPCALFFVHEESWSANRELNVVLPALKKRMEPFLKDEGLPPALRERIEKFLRKHRDISIRHFVFNQAIIGRKKEPLNTALAIMKSENDLSYKATSLIKFAKYVSYNRVVHGIVASGIKSYIQLKKKLLFLKNLRNYKENKYIPAQS